MKIYRPIKTDFLSQKFGENKACAKMENALVPVNPPQIIYKSALTCPIGYKDFYKLIGMVGHNGYDLGAWRGEPVYFNVDADVEWEAATEVDKGGGIGVRVRSKQPVSFESLPKELNGPFQLAKKQYEAQGGKLYIQFVFWHLKSVNVFDKQPVKLGQLLGYADSTGASSGDHLHFAPKATDSTSWFTIDGDNGYTGAFDPTPWYENKFVLDVIRERIITEQLIPAQLTLIQLLNKYIYELKQILKGRNL